MTDNPQQAAPISQEDQNLRAGVFLGSPIETLLKHASSKMRHPVNLRLGDVIMPLWVRKASSTTISRYTAANKGKKQRDNTEISLQMIMDHVDVKVADDDAETDYRPAFEPSDLPALRKISSDALGKLLEAVSELSDFHVEEAGDSD